MKRLLTIIVCILGFGLLTAQSPRSPYSDVSPSMYIPNWTGLKSWIQYEDNYGYSLSPRFLGKTIAEEGRVLMAVLNSGADTLVVGNCVIWDTTRILVCDTAKTKKARIEDNLATLGGAAGLYVYAASGTASDDTLNIYGKNASGAVQTQTLAIVDGDDQVLTPSALWWTKIDSVKDLQSSGGWTTYQVIAVPVCGIRASDGATGQFAGVVSGDFDATGAWRASILPNEVGFVCIEGITSAYVNGASTYIWPGDQLYPAASGRLAHISETASASTSGSATFTQDSLSRVVGKYDLVAPETDIIDSLTVLGHVTLGTFTTTVTPSVQTPVARALELATTNAQLIKVFVK